MRILISLQASENMPQKLLSGSPIPRPGTSLVSSNWEQIKKVGVSKIFTVSIIYIIYRW